MAKNKTFMCTRPQLHDLMCKLGIFPIETIPHPYTEGAEAWLYDRTDVRADIAIQSYYAMIEIKRQRANFKR